MKEKKNIDRIFQEKFKEFEKAPPENLWNNIEAELDKNEGKKPFFIPLWFKISGAAAVLAVILAGILFVNNQSPINSEPQVVFEDTEIQNEVSNENTNNATTETESSVKSANNTNPSSIANTNTLSADRADHQSSSNKTSTDLATNTSNTSGKSKSDIGHIEKNVINPASYSERIVSVTNFLQKPELDSGNSLIPEMGQLMENQDQSFLPNALAELEKSNEEDLNKNNEAQKDKKLRLSTFAAPVVYQNFGSGSQISSQFNNNPSSSEVSFSYGVKLAYSISDKINIRTGISKIHMNHDVNGVSFAPTAIVSSMENIRPAAEYVEVRNDSGPGTLPSELPDGNSLGSNVYIPARISQQFGYIEIPVEIEFSILDSRFGLHLIGGASSLFLDSNSIDLISGNQSTTLGEASNINNTSFSTNLGFGMDYKLNDQLSINIEPIFKYQLNTFENVNDVQPVNMGIYSGLSFRF